MLLRTIVLQELHLISIKYCQVLEKQFPKESYEVKSKKCFYFAHSSGPSEPKLKIEISHDLSHEWLLVVENPGNREVRMNSLCTMVGSIL